ncbi:hypothetical protein F5984_01355 [Rudanella paleaurantiibacter]|uniref:Tetratricopeptide repeat protein n=1 Tax=Rudanella paleaurantiibacter TaxID=2614655 RepID=A0A7J5U4H9_9BACT|nr:hypothetical protein [Rudanella paleaurantiibacter]KAB7732631.1 hypothetical protein F5984_01355 [Rudanella paleaurantiibacter]
MKWLHYGALLLWMSLSGAYAQPPISFGREWQFAQYLADKEAVTEAVYVLERLEPLAQTNAQRDSLNYFRGWLAYTSKDLTVAHRKLLSVSATSPFYTKSRYFGAYCLAFVGNRDSARVAMQTLPTPDSTFRELKALQLGGLALLQRRYADYEAQRQSFTYRSYALVNEQQRLNRYDSTLRAEKRRSPLVAGLYSAALPGLGKIYAGKTKQGIAAFLPILSLGLLTYEGLRKDGPRSARFIGFGSLFTVFYVGNIWGSILSVKVKRNEFRREYDNKILFDMHIPVRNLLN